MRIDRNRGLPESLIQDHIGRLAPHPGQSFQRLARMGNFTAMPVDKLAAEGDDIFGLGPVKPDCLDMLLQPLHPQRLHFGRRVSHREQGLGGLVDAHICCLC